MSTVHNHPNKCDREIIYYKLQFLAYTVEYLCDKPETFYDSAPTALYLLLSDVAKELYPEWEQDLED